MNFRLCHRKTKFQMLFYGQVIPQGKITWVELPWQKHREILVLWHDYRVIHSYNDCPFRNELCPVYKCWDICCLLLHWRQQMCNKVSQECGGLLSHCMASRHRFNKVKGQVEISAPKLDFDIIVCENKPWILTFDSVLHQRYNLKYF